MIDEDHPYRFHAPDEPLVMQADAALLKQAVRILIDNAAKYTKSGDEILLDLLKKDGFDVGKNFTDCGMLIFDAQRQDVHAGGSGCGCSASVLCSYVLNQMEKGIWKRVLFAATGALLSPTTTLQGESIPGIAHALVLEGGK